MSTPVKGTVTCEFTWEQDTQAVDESTLEQVHLKAFVAMVMCGAVGGPLKGLWPKGKSMLEKVPSKPLPCHPWLKTSPS